MMQATWADNLVIIRLHAVQLVDFANALLEWTLAVKNSWSNLFNVNQAQKHKVQVMVNVATSLADMVLVLHGGNFMTAYTTMYNVVRPRVSCGRLKPDDCKMLTKMFGKFNGEDLTLDILEDAFLEENPRFMRMGGNVSKMLECQWRKCWFLCWWQHCQRDSLGTKSCS